MSINAISLIRCPYCQKDHGDILISVLTMDSYCRAKLKAEHLLIHERPEQELFIFESKRPESGPCQHVLQLYGDISWSHNRPNGSDRQYGGLDFDWWHELVDKPGVGEDTCYFLWEVVVDEMTPSRFLPNTPITYERFHRDWRYSTSRTSNSGKCCVQGGVVFAKNVSKVFAELPELICKHESYLEKHGMVTLDD